jgi:dihydrofolate synthase / folylpolyglutamate synthase
VGLDHTDRLGDSVEAIAREKAAIIERGDVAVTGATGTALEIVRRRARRMAAPLTVVGEPPIVEVNRDGIVIELPTLGRTAVGLRGRHQAANAAVADALLDALDVAGIAHVPPAARRAGYAEARWPGRLELVEYRGHDVLLDGAHNPDGAASLARALDDLAPHLAASGPATLLFAVMADKDVEGIVRALLSSGVVRDARLVATTTGATRSLPADALAATWRTLAPHQAVDIAADPMDALDLATSARPGLVIVAGSLYLVGAVRGRILPDPMLVDPPKPDA